MNLLKKINIISGIIFLANINLKANLNQEPRVLYNPKYIKFNIYYTIFNYTRDSSFLYVKIFPKDFLYSYLNNEGKYKAQLKINYIVNEIDINKKNIGEIIDSSTITYDFYREGIPNEIIKKIRIYTPYGKIYVIKINSTDVIRRYTNFKYIIMDKKEYSMHNILPFYIEEDDTIPFFYPYNLKTDSFRIKLNGMPQSNYLFLFKIENYKNPTPIFLNDKNNNDIIYSKEFIATINCESLIKLPHEGYYMLLYDTISYSGISIIYNNMNLPKTKDINNLIKPLIYLTTSNEYLQIINSNNKKLSVDNFWLKLSNNNKEKAKEMIRIFYNRVYYANQYFTSYKEGWQTDRGMIYIVFGIPDMVISEPFAEKWIYFKSTLSNKIEFEFTLDLLPFCNNNYILKRYPEYESLWREAISAWRNGKIFVF